MKQQAPVGGIAPVPRTLSSVGRTLRRRFGDLKVRPKLIVLHNAFFLILACTVYFSLIPLFEDGVNKARLRETSLVVQLFSQDSEWPSLPGFDVYDFRQGTAEALNIPSHIREWLDDNQGLTWRNPDEPQLIYRKVPNGTYRRLHLPDHLYGEMIERAQRTLFIALGIIYLLAVMTLEFIIMPDYVYRPLRAMLRADRATQEDDRAHEIIPESEILADEIGQIMRSRNATVSELRRHEDRLAEKNRLLETAKQRLETQDRLASIGLLSASVAHEVNTPLTVLHGSIEKLIETAANQATRDRLTRMLRVTERLRRISESLTDFARRRKERVEAVALRPIVEEAWNLLAIDDKASAVVYENAVAPEHQVIGNTDRLIQVFVNLLRNSLLAIQPSGRIIVRSEALFENNEWWMTVTVEDDGPGIPTHVLPEIFDAFVTTRLDANGTGLGLTVSEGIVRQHGGTITASNRPGGGARLEVKLRRPYSRRESNMPPANMEATATIDIAVLDDDPDFLNYIEDFLSDEGLYSVRTFDHPDRLFEACERQLPEIVLLDMKMGDFRGDKVLEQLLGRYPGLCVIIVTGYPSLEDMRNTFKLKVFDYLPKPFTLAQLRQTLANAAEAYGLGRSPQAQLRDRLGQRIKLLRTERGWALKELAQSARLSVSQLSSIERGAHLPSIESFLAICRALDRKPSEVLASIDF